jgi:hypothetical protein
MAIEDTTKNNSPSFGVPDYSNLPEGYSDAQKYQTDVDFYQNAQANLRTELNSMPKGVQPPEEGEDTRTDQQKAEYEAYQAKAKELSSAGDYLSVADQNLRSAGVPGTGEIASKGMDDPYGFVPDQKVEKLGDQPDSDLQGQLIERGTGTAGDFDPKKLLEDTVGGMVFTGFDRPSWDAEKQKYVSGMNGEREFTPQELIDAYKPDLKLTDYYKGAQADTTTVSDTDQADVPALKSKKMLDYARIAQDMMNGTKEYEARFDANNDGQIDASDIAAITNGDFTVEATAADNTAKYTPTSTISDVREVLTDVDAANLDDLTREVAAQSMLPEDLAQLDLDAAKIKEAREVADIGDLTLTNKQLVEAATLANAEPPIPLPEAIAQVTGKEFNTNPAKFKTATPEATAAIEAGDAFRKANEIGNMGYAERKVDSNEIPKVEGLGLDPEQSKDITSGYESALEGIEAKLGRGETIDPEDVYNLDPTLVAKLINRKVEDPAKQEDFPEGDAAETDYRSLIDGVKGDVEKEELIDAENIGINHELVSQAVYTTAKTMEELNENAKMKAAQLEQITLAVAAEGEPSAKATVKGQMDILLNEFNDGTPAWAAGALRKANALMAARGLAGSSMAGAAIMQATLEAALPIAQEDAEFFAKFEFESLQNKQAVAIANAAAAQGLELQNLDNLQAAALQNSTNAFSLQKQNLSNLQEVVLANFGVKAALQGKSLDINTQAAISNAARYAELKDLNLTNAQQALLQESSENLTIEMSELSNEQETMLAQLQIKAAIQGQNLSNEQAMAVLQSQQNFAAAEFDATAQQQAFMQDAMAQAALEGKALDARQQTALFNAARIAEVNNITVSNKQQAALQKSTENLTIEVENLNSREQTALANAQLRAALQGKVLDNAQQVAIIESERYAEANNITTTNKQQAFVQDFAARTSLTGQILDNQQNAAIFNVANVVQERGIELSNEQATNLYNTTNNLTIEVENLSNRQATALANAQIEASLRGEELSNLQQERVINAARISEIANINFTTDQQTAVENARLGQTVDIENLTAANAKVLADAAALTKIDVTNLDNRQKAQVENAKNFLQLDLTNLTNEQQTEIFKAQQEINSLFSDQAADNAAEQFNAASENQVMQFFADLEANVRKFNTDQKNAIAQFNAGETNAVEKLNAQLEAARDQFNASNALVIEQANTKWKQDIATIDTAAQNEANSTATAIAAGIVTSVMDQLWQRERDIMDYTITMYEGEEDRNNAIILQKLAGEYGLDVAKLRADIEADKSIGAGILEIIKLM